MALPGSDRTFALVLARPRPHTHAPLPPFSASRVVWQVGNAATFLCSPLASAITGATLYVDNGLNTMGMAVDSEALGGQGA